jgi:hypothetical protein
VGRVMSALRTLSRVLYLASRTSADADALRRGPDVLGKRLVRRAWHRQAYRAMGSAWRWPR